MELVQAHKRCLDSLVWAIGQLDGPIQPAQLENTAELIIQTMTGPWRYFHTPEHIFEVGGSVDPIEVLSALFHDLVYVQVDQGVGLNISSFITPFIKEVRGQLMIREVPDLPNDKMFEIVTSVFGFRSGQILSPFGGQNEFLSAAIAAKSLEVFLNPSIIAQIAACIEATIPFRPKSQSGQTPSELLYQRMININQEFNFGWSDEETLEIVKRAVRLANRDVENFAYPNSGEFLDNTWNLLPETNHELININSYTVAGYRKSLQKMEGFMNFLKPELVFQQFMGEPDDAIYLDLITRTQRNLEVAKLYLGIKLITISILEALAYRLGRDIPLSTMMGELPIPGISTPTLAQFLPEIPMVAPLKNQLESEVLELLNKGRNRESLYDLKNSPVATFIIKSVGFEQVNQLLSRSKEFLAGQVLPEQFLSECDAKMIDAITTGVLKLFESRSYAIKRGF